MAPCKDIAWLFLTTPPFLETSLLITNQPSCLPVSSCSLSLHIRISSLTFSPSSLSSSLIFTSPPLSRSLSQLSNASAMITVKCHKKVLFQGSLTDFQSGAVIVICGNRRDTGRSATVVIKSAAAAAAAAIQRISLCCCHTIQ